jgi:hypothetical protein
VVKSTIHPINTSKEAATEAEAVVMVVTVRSISILLVLCKLICFYDFFPQPATAVQAVEGTMHPLPNKEAATEVEAEAVVMVVTVRSTPILPVPCKLIFFYDFFPQPATAGQAVKSTIHPTTPNKEAATEAATEAAEAEAAMVVTAVCISNSI